MANSSVYLDPSEMPVYYDKRRLLQLISDTGLKAGDNDLSTPASDAYQLMFELIRSVSSLIDSRCQVGKRYTRADLEKIIQDVLDHPSDSQTNTVKKRAGILKQLTADLAFGSLIARRGFGEAELRKLAPRYEDALLTLEQLYQGVNVFDLDANIAAGVPKTVMIAKNRINSTDFNRMFGIWPNSPLDHFFGDWRW